MSVRAPSRFTPSLLSADVLEQLFVARTGLVDEIMARVQTATRTSNRSHTLLVGPRGAGKTHIVSIVAHRTAKMRERGTKVQLAWLAEDLWTVDSYASLILLIANEAGLTAGRPTDAAQLERALTASARANGPIVVVVENLDQVLDALDDTEQQRLRAMLANGTFLFVATTTQLSRHLSDQAVPFYGFFTVTRLSDFSLAEATAMLARIASYAGDEDLAAYLRDGRAAPRLNAVAHLAGGTPRIWATLASALTVGQLDELVELLLTRFDDLTPYYQEQLRSLSPQQRKVVAKIAELDHPINVKDLAAALDTSDRSMASVLGELNERGWVRPVESIVLQLTDKRRTYYELAEPLARLAFQLKAARGKPVRLLVDFLKTWFEPADLEAGLNDAASGAYIREAIDCSDAVTATALRLQRLPTYRTPIVDTLAEVDCALRDLESGDPSAMLQLSTVLRLAIEQQLATVELAAIRTLRSIIHSEAMLEFGFVPHPAMADWIDRADEVCANDDGTFIFGLIAWLSRAWRFDEANLIVDQFVSLVGSNHPNALLIRNQLALCYWHAGRTDEAIVLQEDVLKVRQCTLGTDHPSTLITRNNLANSYNSAGRTTEAITMLEGVVTGRERTLGTDHPSTLISRNNLANAYGAAGRVDEATQMLEEVVVDSVRILGQHHPDTFLAQSNLAQSYQSAGRLDEAHALFLTVLANRERILGAAHPDTIQTSSNLASSYRSLGQTEQAITLQESVVADRQRILGTDHPTTLITRHNLAISYQTSGRTAEATSLLQAVLEDSERTLGPGHPETIVTRTSLAAILDAARAPVANHHSRSRGH